MIAGIVDWGKRREKTLMVIILIVLVGTAAFGLGRLSALNEADRGLVIYEPENTSSQPHD